MKRGAREKKPNDNCCQEEVIRLVYKGERSAIIVAEASRPNTHPIYFVRLLRQIFQLDRLHRSKFYICRLLDEWCVRFIDHLLLCTACGVIRPGERQTNGKL